MIVSEARVALRRAATIALASDQVGRVAIVFFLLKAVSFAAPLLLGNVLRPTDYGTVEYALSLGLLWTSLTAAGMPAAVPYYLLRERDPKYETVFGTHVLLALLLGIVGVALLPVSWISVRLALTIALTGTATVQLIQASRERSVARNVRAMLFDSASYLWMMLLLAAAILLPNVPFRNLLAATLMVQIVMLAIDRARDRHAIRAIPAAEFWPRYGRVLRFSGSLLLAGFLGGFVASGARVVIGRLLTTDDVAVYSQYFRVSCALLLIHQLVVAAFFRQMYEASPATFDRYAAILLAGLATIALACGLVLPVVTTPFLTIVRETISGHRILFLLLPMHVVLWIASAQNEILIYRERLAAPATALLIGWCAVLILGAWSSVKTGHSSIEWIVRVNLLVLLLHVQSQYAMLARRGFALPRSRLVVLFATALVLITDGLTSAAGRI